MSNLSVRDNGVWTARVLAAVAAAMMICQHSAATVGLGPGAAVNPAPALLNAFAHAGRQTVQASILAADNISGGQQPPGFTRGAFVWPLIGFVLIFAGGWLTGIWWRRRSPDQSPAPIDHPADEQKDKLSNTPAENQSDGQTHERSDRHTVSDAPPPIDSPKAADASQGQLESPEPDEEQSSAQDVSSTSDAANGPALRQANDELKARLARRDRRIGMLKRRIKTLNNELKAAQDQRQKIREGASQSDLGTTRDPVKVKDGIITALEEIVAENREKWLLRDATEAHLDKKIADLTKDLKLAMKLVDDRHRTTG